MNGKALCPFPNTQMAYSGMEIAGRRAECIREKCELWVPILRGEEIVNLHHTGDGCLSTQVSVSWVEPSHCSLTPARREYPEAEGEVG